MTLDELLIRQVSEQPDSQAVADAPNRADIMVGEPQRLTWQEVDVLVDAFSADLVELGASPGTAVAIQLPNTVELVVALLACFRTGSVAVPFPIQHREHELTMGFGLTEPTVFVTAPRPDRLDQMDIANEVAARSAEPPVVLDVTTRRPDSISRVRSDVTARSADEITTVCWTSGTTGTPKGVPRTDAMWQASGSFQVDALALGPDDRLLCPFPLVNMAGIGGLLVPWLMSGATLHLHQPLNLPIFLQQIATEAITYTVAPPAVLNMLLLKDDEIDWAAFSSIRMISSGAAPLDPWMVDGWQERGIEIVNVFGSNEGAAMLSTRSLVPDPAQRARCFPQPDSSRVETRLVDMATGDDIVQTGQPGELRFRGPTVFGGYLGSTGEEFDDLGFFRSGDLFEWADLDADPPLLRFVDRAKDIIIRGGMNISAAEVEALITGSGLVAECAVIGYPDDELGERVGLVAVAPPDGGDPTLNDVGTALRELGVASYKHPERLELVDVLPRNPVGKVVKGELRARWADADAVGGSSP